MTSKDTPPFTLNIPLECPGCKSAFQLDLTLTPKMLGRAVAHALKYYSRPATKEAGKMQEAVL